MSRVTTSAALIVASLGVLVSVIGLSAWQEVAVALAVVAVTGFVPFLIGLVAQAVGRSPLPAWAPWVLAGAAAAIRWAAPQLGGLMVVDSEAAAVGLTFVIAGSFAELGSALVRGLRSRTSRAHGPGTAEA